MESYFSFTINFPSVLSRSSRLDRGGVAAVGGGCPSSTVVSVPHCSPISKSHSEIDSMAFWKSVVARYETFVPSGLARLKSERSTEPFSKSRLIAVSDLD